MKQDCMTGFVISCDLLFFFGNDFAAFLCSDTNLDKGMLDIRLCDIGSVRIFAAMIAASFRRFSRSAPVNPAVVCAICARSTSSPSGLSFAWTLRISSLSLYIRSADCNLTVKTSRTQDCRIKNIHTVGRCHYDDSLIDTKSVHLNEELVQGLLSLIVAAAHTGTTLSCNCIDLIDKNDTWCMLLCLLQTGLGHGMHLHRQTFPRNQNRK